MNAITLLTDEHAAMKKLLSELESTTERGVKTREELFGRIKTDLTLHEIIEEEIFYPALKEHPKAKVMQENIEHHMEEEEGDMFKKARQVFEESELEELGDRMARRREQAVRDTVPAAR